MPELPEVETVRRGIAPHLLQHRLLGATIRDARLRWAIPTDLEQRIRERTVLDLKRRGKYLLMQLDDGWLILHLGMSGSLRLCPASVAPGKHDHVDLCLDDGQVLRYRDPRRFGALLWTAAPEQHPLIANLGIEPLEAEFTGGWLYRQTRHRRTPIKTLLMDAHTIVGVGNIYANESLFLARIHPLTQSGRIGLARCGQLVEAIKSTLTRAIAAGGSSLRDFVDGHGNPGYFQQTYNVYGRAGLPCTACTTPLQETRLAGRTTCFCPSCQKR